jgi:hypothetical protein
MLLDDELIELVIKEAKNLWPECKLVWGSPCHSKSNSGVERVNQMVQKKLGAWIKENNSTHWAIGCKICQWRYNNHVHQTIKDTPYHLFMVSIPSLVFQICLMHPWSLITFLQRQIYMQFTRV